jgi:Flp pilus assembly secretin CpaC
MPRDSQRVRNEDELVSFITPKMVKDSGSGETPPQDGSSAQ